MLVGIVLDLFNPYLTQIMIDKVITGKKYGLLTSILAAIAFIAIARAILGYIKEYGFDWMSTQVAIDIKEDLFDHIHQCV